MELFDTIDYYELESIGLGKLFYNEVAKAIERIIYYPEVWAKEHKEIRKCLIRKFPYKVLYSIEKDFILVLAIAHQHRKPFYWIDDPDTKLKS